MTNEDWMRQGGGLAGDDRGLVLAWSWQRCPRFRRRHVGTSAV